MALVNAIKPIVTRWNPSIFDQNQKGHTTAAPFEAVQSVAFPWPLDHVVSGELNEGRPFGQAVAGPRQRHPHDGAAHSEAVPGAHRCRSFWRVPPPHLPHCPLQKQKLLFIVAPNPNKRASGKRQSPMHPLDMIFRVPVSLLVAKQGVSSLGTQSKGPGVSGSTAPQVPGQDTCPLTTLFRCF